MWIFVYICIIKDNNNQTNEAVEEADAGAAATDETVEETDAGAAAMPAPASDVSTQQQMNSPVTSLESVTSPLSPPSLVMLEALLHSQKGIKYHPSAKPTTSNSAVPINTTATP